MFRTWSTILTGKTSFTWFGPVPRVTIAEPELVREVLSNKFGHFGRLQRMLHHGRMLPAFAACCSDLVKRWEGLVADGKLPCEVDVWPEMQNLTGDVIARAAFGSSYLEGRRIFQLQAEQIHLVVQAMNKFYIPGYLYLPTRTNRRMKKLRSLRRSMGS
uniref:Cytochrome P450 n=1 Tax=Setaria viridis TaxID=4556 RepID=A0A4U6V2G2_SETVI|nr:hypothetical protein SEVIR_4G196102v2 [Setaria viridis]